MKRGFDEFYGFLGHGGHDYFDLKRTGENFNSILRNYEPIDETGYLTDNLGREAVSYIGRNADKPFFLYLAFNAVHAPMQAPDAAIKKYDTGDPKRDTLMAMIECENNAIGKVLDELERQKLEQNTILVFVSDNGGARANASNKSPRRNRRSSRSCARSSILGARPMLLASARVGPTTKATARVRSKSSGEPSVAPGTMAGADEAGVRSVQAAGM
jgi:arylsulfatase A-like enzyme